MTRPHRGLWAELEVDGEELLVHPGWTSDTDTLAIALRETGWFPTTREAYEAANEARLSWGWVGVDDDLHLRACHWNGLCDAIGDYVSDVSQVTLASITRLG